MMPNTVHRFRAVSSSTTSPARTTARRFGAGPSLRSERSVCQRCCLCSLALARWPSGQQQSMHA
eukprot:353504-Chlamydomonas_euryale.AAC.7